MYLKKLELSGFKSFVPILSKFQMFYFYILKSFVSSKYYIGSTNNIEDRIKLHNTGMVKSTHSDRPWKIIHSELFDSLVDARRRELQVKRWKSRKAIERLFLNIWNLDIKIEDPRFLIQISDLGEIGTKKTECT